MKWNIYLHWLSGELLLPSSIQSLPASLGLVNDTRAQTFKRSIPFMSGDLIFKLPYKTGASIPGPIFQPTSTSFYPCYIMLEWCNPASHPRSPPHSRGSHPFIAICCSYHKYLYSWPVPDLLLEIQPTNQCCTVGSRLDQSCNATFLRPGKLFFHMLLLSFCPSFAWVKPLECLDCYKISGFCQL